MFVDTTAPQELLIQSHAGVWLKSSVFLVQVGFNVELGGYFSGKRNTMSIDGNTFLARDQVVAYCEALLKVFRCEDP